MQVQTTPSQVTIWLSARDTDGWAHKPGAAWPCSVLSGRRLVATLDSNGLCDLTVNGRDSPDDLTGVELSAICADHLAGRLHADHPAYFVAVGQFDQSAASTLICGAPRGPPPPPPRLQPTNGGQNAEDILVSLPSRIRERV